MAGADLSTLSTILKEYYLGPVTEQLNNEVLLLSRLESKSEDLVGKRAYVPLHWGRSGGIGARSEGETLPVAGKQQYEKAVYDLKYLYGVVRVTGPSMAKTKNEAGAFLQALKSELDGVRNDLKKDLARQVYGNGTGVVATVATNAANSTTVAYVGTEALRKGQLYPGFVATIYDASATADLAGTHTISAVDVTAGTVTFAAAVGVPLANNDTIRRAGVKTSSATEGNTYSLSDEVDGLRRIVSNTATALGGITPTGNAAWWDNQRIAASGASSTDGSSTKALTLEDIQKGLNLARIAGGMPSSVITSLGIQREFYMLLQDYVRYVEPDSSMSYGAGFKTLSYNGMPVIADIDAPYGQMYILDEATMKVFSDQDWHFLDADGLTLRQVTGVDAFEAILARYMNLGATRRNNQVVITGIGVDLSADAGY